MYRTNLQETAAPSDGDSRTAVLVSRLARTGCNSNDLVIISEDTRITKRLESLGLT